MQVLPHCGSVSAVLAQDWARIVGRRKVRRRDFMLKRGGWDGGLVWGCEVG